MEDIWLARTPADTLVGLPGEAERPLYNLHLLAVIAFEVSVEHVAESLLDHAVFRFGGESVVLAHNKEWLHP